MINKKSDLFVIYYTLKLVYDHVFAYDSSVANRWDWNASSGCQVDASMEMGIFICNFVSRKC